jgi:hypothetical protein
VRSCAGLIQKRGWPVVLKSIKIITMSSYADKVDEALSVDALARAMGSTYEPRFLAAMLRRDGKPTPDMYLTTGIQYFYSKESTALIRTSYRMAYVTYRVS